jgi:hypothetical protein
LSNPFPTIIYPPKLSPQLNGSTSLPLNYSESPPNSRSTILAGSNSAHPSPSIMPLQRLRDEPPAVEATPASTRVAPLRSQGEFYMVGLTPVTPNVSLAEECIICMETLTTDVVKMAACDHHFHTVCILSWFESSVTRSGKKKGTCPNCRHEFYEPDSRPAPRVVTSTAGSTTSKLGSFRAHDDAHTTTPSIPCWRHKKPHWTSVTSVIGSDYRLSLG